MNVDAKRILIVDGDGDGRGSLASLLRRQFINVDDVASSAAAIEKLAENRYAVLLLDISSPDSDHEQVLDFMANVPAPAAPVVLLLAGAESHGLSSLDPQRIHGIIRKPYDAEELAGLVRACAEIKSRNALGAMCMATMLAGGPILALLSQSKL